MTRAQRSPDALIAAALALGLGALVVAIVVVPGVWTGLLYLAPALALAAPLARGRYVGAERVTRLTLACRRRPRRREAASRPAPLRAAAVLLPRGGRLVATALAVRPPPAPAPAM